MKIAVVCANGIGDALIMLIASYHLKKHGYDVTTASPHRFGNWLPQCQFAEPHDADLIFLQHDNTKQSQILHDQNKPVFTFYGQHLASKHGPLRQGLDYVCNPSWSMVDNVIASLQALFHIQATPENGLLPPAGLVHRRYPKRVAIHTGSAQMEKNWPTPKFLAVVRFLEKQDLQPHIIPLFPSIEELCSFIYESGYFIGNDSGPGHIASYLQIPSLIIAKSHKQMRLWRPGWKSATILTPPHWIPNWKGSRLREKYWKQLVTINKVIKTLKCNVLCN